MLGLRISVLLLKIGHQDERFGHFDATTQSKYLLAQLIRASQSLNDYQRSTSLWLSDRCNNF